MSNQELTEIIKLLGKRTIKIEKTLLHHSTKLKTTASNINSFSNLEKRLEILENNIDTSDVSKNISNIENTDYKEKIDNYIEDNIKLVKEAQLKLYESQIKLNKNIELLENSIKSFEKKIKLF